MSTKYFVRTDLRTGKPTGLHRSFEGENREVESLTEEGWISVPGLLFDSSSGEITEEEARQIAKERGFDLRNITSDTIIKVLPDAKQSAYPVCVFYFRGKSYLWDRGSIYERYKWDNESGEPYPDSQPLTEEQLYLYKDTQEKEDHEHIMTLAQQKAKALWEALSTTVTQLQNNGVEFPDSLNSFINMVSAQGHWFWQEEEKVSLRDSFRRVQADLEQEVKWTSLLNLVTDLFFILYQPEIDMNAFVREKVAQAIKTEGLTLL